MMYIKQLVILVGLCLIHLFAFSQDKAFDKANFANDAAGLKQAKKEVRRGDYYLSIQDHKNALKHFLIANDFNPDNALLNMKIGDCYLSISNDRTNAEKHLTKAIELNPQIDSYANFLMGKLLHHKMQWDEAIKNYEKYLMNPGKTNLVSAELISKYIRECRNGKTLSKSPLNVEIKNLGEIVNSKYAEYCPIISADESVLIFTSRRNNTTGGGKDEAINDYYEDLYISEKVKGQWSKPKNMGKPVNTEQHDATVGLSPDGQKLLIYKDDNGNGNIYECILKGDKWSAPNKLCEYINSEYQEPSACFSHDGKYIYFVSDRPEGLGGKDIYVVKLMKKGKCSRPKNIGKNINTKYDEDAVFMHPDGKTLYFSSQGHNTIGGYDIFKVEKKGRSWKKPVNMGLPINTPGNDVFFVISASGKHGYYSSVQKDGLGEKDLYIINFIKDTAIIEEEPRLTLLKGIISDENTSLPIEASIEIINNVSNEIISSLRSNSTSGKYLVSLPSGMNYGISVSANGYLFHSENFNIADSAGYQEVEIDIALKKIETGKKIILNNLFFDYGQASLRSESTAELSRLLKLLQASPSLKIEISGHTDNQGSVDYNNKLSEQRAKAVVSYLIEKGINNNRLKYAGYGFSQPIESNKTEEGRKTNRRVEFSILEN